MKRNLVIAGALMLCACGPLQPGERTDTAEPAAAAVGHSDNAVRNGAVDNLNTWFNVVRIVVTVNGQQSLCSGTVVTPTRVLTAAHCVAGVGAAAVRVDYEALGGTPAGTRAATALRVHPTYTATGRVLGHSTIPGGAVSISEGVDLATIDVGLAFPFAARALAAAPAATGSYTAVGYGQISTNVLPTTRRVGAVNVPAVLPMLVNKTQRVSGAHLVAVPAPNTINIACGGDSGGPLINANGEVCGVVSTGATGSLGGCDDIVNNLYTGVYDFRSWILPPAGAPLAYHNYTLPIDVNNDGFVTAIDALTVINALNAGTGLQTAPFAFRDVNGDNLLSAIDALTVINAINRPVLTGNTVF